MVNVAPSKIFNSVASAKPGYDILSVLTSIAVYILESSLWIVTASSAIFSVVTLASFILTVSTQSLALIVSI